MSLVFHRKPIAHSAKTLQVLLEKFSPYTGEIKPVGSDEEKCETLLSTINLILGSINTIEQSRSSLQSLVDKLQREFDDAKTKANKKELEKEVEDIDSEIKFTEIIAKANEMKFMLGARLTEAKNQAEMLSRKMGIKLPKTALRQPEPAYNQSGQPGSSSSVPIKDGDEVIDPNDAMWLSEDTSEGSRDSVEEDFICRTLKPKQMSLPRFWGDEEEFPEFWAVYETLVHQNKVLSTVEKMLLLKDSLKGRAEMAIKGIQLIPQNYKWMVDTLKKKYGNKPVNRAKIVQKLIDLPGAKNNGESCTFIFDKIRMLINQMVSAGQDIPNMQDAMWTEKILEKFPYSIVKNVLISIQEMEEVKVEDVMEQLDKEINAKKYVESRLKGRSKTEFQEFRKYQPQEKSQVQKREKTCIFCDSCEHFPSNCRAVTDVQQKRNIVIESKRCWKCFTDQHRSNQCSRPNCPNCARMHHISLCFQNTRTPENSGSPNNRAVRFANTPAASRRPPAGETRGNPPGWRNRASNDARQRDQTSSLHAELTNTSSLVKSSIDKNTRDQVVLMTAEANIWNHNTSQFERVLVFFDTGAQRTIILEKTAEEFGLPKQRSDLCTMSGIGGHIEKFRTFYVPLRISTIFGRELNMVAQTKPVITNGFPSAHLLEEDKQYLQENDICLCNPRIRGEHQNPQILVGLDYYYEFVMSSRKTVLPSGLYVARTVLGPTLHGRGSICADEKGSEDITHALTLVQESSETEILQKIFELDGLGISANEFTNDEKTFEYFENYSKAISFDGGVVTAPFPLKDNVIDLSDNYGMAYRRLEALQRQLATNTELRSWYTKILDEYFKSGIIEKANDKIESSAGTYYMPHSGVWKPLKAKPLRIVFDASSKQRGKLSLNDVIHTGESFVNKIHDILIRCRFSKFILTCDIEAAFTQIRLIDEHKDLCRFLWIKDINRLPTKDNIIVYRFNRLPFGVTASPSVLNMAILAYLNMKDTPISNEIARNIYVDNILLTAENETEVLEKYTESKNLFKEIGMNLREYVSNSKKVNECIPDPDRSPSGDIKILGLPYNTETDEFSIKIDLPTKARLTKRDVVSLINSVYDPLGVTAPLIVKLKSLMREIYETGIDWNEVVSTTLTRRWNSVCDEINNVRVRFPRSSLQYVRGIHTSKAVLWMFCDASNLAISTCAFLRDNDTKEVTQLISGKSKLTPKKCRQTIPRLEMLGILIGMRLGKNILDNLDSTICQMNIVSDSEIALQWIKSSRKLPAFVSNQKDRIGKIRSYVESKGIQVKFFHIPTEANPADAGTRGLKAAEINSHDWLRGPRWLALEPSNWKLRSIDILSEVEHVEENVTWEHATIEVREQNAESKSTLVDLSRFSRFKILLRTVARVGKLLRKWIDRCNSARSTLITTSFIKDYDPESVITCDEITLSEKLIIASLHKNIDLQKLKKRFPNQIILKDEFGIIRYKSRIQNAALPFDTRMPIYVVNDSDLARLIIIDLHYENAHCGKDHILSLARQKYWIPQPSRAIRRFVKNCPTCKRCHGLPYGAPEMPPLPPDRVTISKPFRNVGCDFMGPFQSKTNENMYICLYTCLATRAVHLEVVENLSTGAFLNSFIRFVSRRGVPRLMRSDCGTNFKLGQKIIETLFEQNEITGNSVMNYSASEGIKWIFNPPASPWMGGVWERLVGSVKRSLHKSIGRRKLSFEQMVTVITRIEAIINTRPITKLSSSDLSEIPLRPIDFLQGNLKFSIPSSQNSIFINDPLYETEIIQTAAQAYEALAYSETIASKFWEKWNFEYLTVLRDSHRCQLNQPRHVNKTPLVGEIVLIEQELLPRGQWIYGKIEELIKSADGMIRSAKILMPNHKILQRPLNKIYPLEIRSLSDPSEERNPNNIQHVPQNPPPPRTRGHLARDSKSRALDNIREFEADLDRSTTPTSGGSSVSSLVMAMLAILVIDPAAAQEDHIRCYNGTVFIAPPKGKFELCFNQECRTFTDINEEMKFTLPISPLRHAVGVKIRSTQHSGVISTVEWCEPPDVCAETASILSIDLIGNPHCWPVGAVITVTIAFYSIIAAVMSIIWAVSLYRKRKQQGFNVEVGFEMNMFRPSPLIASATVMLSILALVSGCQHGYMRHTVEMVCESRGKCLYEFNQEILFNKISPELCIQINHSNTTVGVIKISNGPIKLTCNKVSLFFTRDTMHKFFRTTRCPQMGSCTRGMCNKIYSNGTIPELEMASVYPGYITCDQTCGGLACGCFLPFPACSFLRLAQIPKSRSVYELVRCMEWTPVVQVDIDITMYNRGSRKSMDLVPYITQKHDNLSITVISIQKPHFPLMDRRFALSESEALTLPDDYILPVECDSKVQAQEEFSKCVNRMICVCENLKAPRACKCPQDSIRNLRKDITNIFPIKTPFTEIRAESGDINAYSQEGEITIVLQSNFMINSSNYIIEQPCDITFEEIRGCYSCFEGAQVNVSCKTDIAAWATVECESQVFSIQCGPSNRSNVVSLEFNRALIQQRCHTLCNGRELTFDLRGTLVYHPRYKRNQLFPAENDEKESKTLFENFDLPDLQPLARLFTEHWKLVLGALGALAITTVMTYIMEPTIIILVIKIIIHIFKFLLTMVILISKLIVTCIGKCCAIFAKRRV